jgi:hypothetical protein
VLGVLVTAANSIQQSLHSFHRLPLIASGARWPRISMIHGVKDNRDGWQTVCDS